MKKIKIERAKLIAYLTKDWSASKIAHYYGRTVNWVLSEIKRQRLKYRKWNYGYRAPGWKSGWWIDKDGYKLVFVPEHPSKTYKRYVREHRLIMEKHLKRYLKRTEVVHHKNGNKLDNRIENLHLFSKNGQHLKKELTGKVPKWTRQGKINMRVGVIQGWKKRGYKLTDKSILFLKNHT